MAARAHGNTKRSAPTWTPDSTVADPLPPPPMDREELSFYVRHHLTRQERLVIMLRYAEELEFTEIASILGIQPAEVEQIHAAIAGRLTEALAECELALA